MSTNERQSSRPSRRSSDTQEQSNFVKDAIQRKQRFNNPFSSFMSSIGKKDNTEENDWNALCSEMKVSFENENGKIVQEKEEEEEQDAAAAAAMHGSFDLDRSGRSENGCSEGRLSFSSLNKNLANLFLIGSDQEDEGNTDWNALFTELNRHGKLPEDENEWHALYKQAVESTRQTTQTQNNVKTPTPDVPEDDDEDDRDDGDDDVEHEMKFCLDLDGFMDRSARSGHCSMEGFMNRSTNSEQAFNMNMDDQENPCLNQSTRSEGDLFDHSEPSQKNSWFGRKAPLTRRPSEFSRRDLLPELSERSIEVGLALELM
jgi:hypothetical protein